MLDGACMVFCAVAGVQPQSETVWRQADKYKVPRLAFINKLDRVGANFFKVYDQMKERLRRNAVPIQLPIGAEDEFPGVVDLVDDEGDLLGRATQGTKFEMRDIPADLADARDGMARADDRERRRGERRADDKYLEGQATSVAEIKAAMRKRTIAQRSSRCSAAPRSGTRASSRCSTR